MSGRERIEVVSEPRNAALNWVSSGGKNTLRVDKFLDAGAPSGESPEMSYATGYATPTSTHFANAKTGVTGHVVETGKSFTVRDDYDFANPGDSGKGYHVNAQLGKETVAFVQRGSSTLLEYYDRTNMTGERVYFDGEEEAGEWYVTPKK